jgi:hypothetical protein
VSDEPGLVATLLDLQEIFLTGTCNRVADAT